jgi:hypothetical protein
MEKLEAGKAKRTASNKAKADAEIKSHCTKLAKALAELEGESRQPH